MTVNELIAALQALPEEVRALPAATSAHGHTYSARHQRRSHGPLIMATHDANFGEMHLVIGDMLDEGTRVFEGQREQAL